MNLQADLQWIQNELKEVKDPALISFFKNILQNRKKVTSDKISVEQYNEELDVAIKDIEEGNTMSSDAVKEMIKEWSEK